jgi:hypothetical protein
MSEDLKNETGDEELNRQYRTALHTLEEIHKRKLIESIANGIDLDRSQKQNSAGCGCVLWTLFMLMIGFTGAACMSWMFNHSMLQAFVHGLIGWIYICYKAFWYVVTTY